MTGRLQLVLTLCAWVPYLGRSLPTETPLKYTPGDLSGESLRRSAPGGRLISLNEARRTRQGSSVRPLGRVERGLLIPWPWAPQEAEVDAEGPSRRQRLVDLARALPTGELRQWLQGGDLNRWLRGTDLVRWLPTAYFFVALLGLVLLALATRSVVMGFAGSGAPVAEPAGAVRQAPAEPIVIAPPAVPTPQIRFEVRQLQPTYTVAAGDSLSAIAQRVGTTTAALAGINNLADNAILNVGQRLIIP